MNYESVPHKRFTSEFKKDSMGAMNYIEYLEGRLDSSLHKIVKLESEKNLSKLQVRDLERHISGDVPCEGSESKLITIDDVLKLLSTETNNYPSLVDMGKKNGVTGRHIRRVLNKVKSPGPKILDILHLKQVTRYVATE